MRTFAAVVLGLLVVTVVSADTAVEVDEVGNSTEHFEEKFNQVVWRKCALQLTPTCLKLTLARLVDRLADDTNYQLLPGVLLSSNRSRALQKPTSRQSSDLSLQQRLDGFLLEKVAGYLRSLTLSVRLLDLPTLNSTDIVDSVIYKVTGRKNKGGAGVGALALMMGGAMMTMMMAALAALAGKALMTSMMALMLAALSAMKGGGGGGGKSTHYEIIAQPEVSHSHSHSAEVQHGHWKRSLRNQVVSHSAAI